jgi:CHAT domain-containing protein/tetratricopeptide (TPR) repeat protein
VNRIAIGIITSVLSLAGLASPLFSQTTNTSLDTLQNKVGKMTPAALSASEKRLKADAAKCEKGGDFRKCLATLDELALISERMGKPDDAAGAFSAGMKLIAAQVDSKEKVGLLLTRGASFEEAARFENAGKCFEAAARAAKRLNDSAVALDALRRLAAALTRETHYPDAVKAYEDALGIATKSKDDRGAAAVMFKLGDVNKDWGRNAEAIEWYKKGREAALKANDTGLTADAYESLGVIMTLVGRFPDAADNYQKALTAVEKLDDPKRESMISTNLGDLYRRIGKYAEAAAGFEKALNAIRKVNDPAVEALALTNLGELYSEWGWHARAMEQYQAALKLSRKAGVVDAGTGDLLRMARCLEQMGRYEEALKRAEDALNAARRAGAPLNEAAYAAMGLCLDVGNTRKAAELVKVADSDAAYGRFYLASGEPRKAVERYTKAVEEAEATGRSKELFAAYTGLGSAYEQLKDYPKAIEYFTKGLDHTERLRSGLLPALRRNFLDVRIDGFPRSAPAWGLVRVLSREGRWAETIQFSELTKGRSFSDRIAFGSDKGYSGVPQAVLDEDHDKNATLAALRELRDCCSKKEDPKRFETLSKEIEKAEKELDEFIEKLRREYPHYASVKYPKPIKLQDLDLAGAGYSIVYDVLGDGVAVRLLNGNEVVAGFFEPWKADDLAKAVARFRAPFEEVKFEAFNPTPAHEFYTRLVAPVLDKAPAGAPLMIVPDGVLALLPFQALVVEGKAAWKDAPWGRYPTGLTFLGDAHPLRYARSLTALGLLSARKATGETCAKPFLGIADPVFDMKDTRAVALGAAGEPSAHAVKAGDSPKILMGVDLEGIPLELTFDRLEKTEVLARNLARAYGADSAVYLGLKANKRLFFEEVAPNIHEFKNVVFATHGVYSTDIPGLLEPVLALTMVPPGTDGLLRMSEVMSLNMNADVVALTACQTALGANLTGEGVMSMGNAFLWAGAKSVLMTLWSVEENASALFVETFFKKLKEGKSKVEAMAAARNELREAGYDHPFFWAPFVLMGSAG